MNISALFNLLSKTGTKVNFENVSNLVKNNKGKITLGSGILGLGYIKTREEAQDNNQQQTTNTTQKQEQKPQEQKSQPKAQEQKSQPKAQEKKPQKQTNQSQEQNKSLPPLNQVLQNLQTPTQTPTNNTGSGDGSFNSMQQELKNLFTELDKYRQAYDTALEKHMQANELYEKQLLATLPMMSLLLSKTPLNNMTNEDLIHHTTQLFTSMPYANALENFSKLTKGYYLAKMNNVNPSELSTGDIIAIADNPVLAKSADENLAGYLEQIGEVLKLKMKSNLDEIGALKDAFSAYKSELDEKGKLLKEIIDMKKIEMMLGINMFKAQTQAQHYERSDYNKDRHNRVMEKINEEKTDIKKKEAEQKANKTKETKKKEEPQSVIPKT